MPYSQPFVKVNIEGQFGASTTNIIERWQAGFHLTKNGGVIGGTTELTAFLSAIRSAILAYHADINVASGTHCYLTSVSGAYIGTDGKYALGALQNTTRVNFTSVTAGTGASNLPWSSACVISLRSLLTRGPASHGRIYYPRTGAGIDTNTGVILSGTLTGIVTAAQTLVNALNTQASGVYGTGTNVGLVSPKGTGFQSPVVRVGIGQKMDSMESRERDIPEAHVFANTAVSAALLEDLDDEFRRQMEEMNSSRPS